jgi:hypothetical protein
MRSASLLLLLSATSSSSDAADCVGYLVSGAGSPAVDGCYTQKASAALFELDSGHQLYPWQGVWRLGLTGKNTSYAEAAPSSWPLESSGGCGSAWELDGGRDPCPAVKRSHMGPLPPAPPAPPAPPPPSKPHPAPLLAFYHPILTDRL